MYIPTYQYVNLIKTMLITLTERGSHLPMFKPFAINVKTMLTILTERGLHLSMFTPFAINVIAF